MKQSKAQRENDYSQKVILSLLVGGLFLLCVKNPFVNLDDPENFLKNPHLMSSFADHFSWAWSTDLLGVYQPLAWHLLWIQAKISHLSPSFFHFVSVLLHLINTLLVFKFAQVFWNKKSEGIGALVCTLFFALHPLRVEAVAWVSCQPYLWSILFGLLSTRYYLKALFLPTGKVKNKSISLLFLALGLLCKAVLLSLPALFLCLTFYFEKEEESESKNFSMEKIYSTAFKDRYFWLASFFIIAANVQVRGLNPQAADRSATGIKVAAIPFVLLTSALQKLVFPISLSPFNPLPSPVWIFLLVLFCFALIGLWYQKSKQDRNLRYLGIALGVLFFPGMGSAITERLAFEDRFTYLPSIALAVGLFPYFSKESFFKPAFAVFAVWFALTANQIGYWSDSQTLWKHAVETAASRSGMAHGNLGMAYIEKGEWDLAEQSLLSSLELDASRPEVHNGLALVNLTRENFEKARIHLQTALEIRPQYPEALSNLGFLELESGNTEEALTVTSQALQLDPYLSKTYELRTRIYEKLKYWNAGLEDAKRLVALTPEDGEAHYLLARFLVQTGKYTESIEELRIAASLLPNNAKIHEALAEAEKQKRQISSEVLEW